MFEQLSLFGEEKKYILMSLREEYYFQMINGEKKYEYRTRFLKEECSAFIYISKTLKKIVAVIEFDKPIYGSDTEIAAISEKERPGSYQASIEWLQGRKCYAIPVKKIIPIAPVSLEELQHRFLDFSVPQSYYNLNKKTKVLDFLLSRLESVSELPNNLIKNYFNQVANSYDEKCQATYWKLCDNLLWFMMEKELAKQKDIHFLDMGGGTGEWSRRILERFPESTGMLVDYSENMLRIAEKKLASFGQRIKIINEDINNLGKNINDCFNVILNIYVLPFCDDDQNIIWNAVELLKPKGILICAAENYYNGLALNILKGGNEEIQKMISTRKSKILDQMPEMKFYSAQQLINLFKQLELEINVVIGYPVVSLIGVSEVLTEDKSTIDLVLNQSFDSILDIEKQLMIDSDNINRGKYICIIGEKNEKNCNIERNDKE